MVPFSDYMGRNEQCVTRAQKSSVCAIYIYIYVYIYKTRLHAKQAVGEKQRLDGALRGGAAHLAEAVRDAIAVRRKPRHEIVEHLDSKVWE